VKTTLTKDLMGTSQMPSNTESDVDLYKVVETQINPEVQTPRITKVIRQGFQFGEQLLRPVEVIIDRPPTNQSN
jgi:molecular chaperone GrpE (heat shock protein)